MLITISLISMVLLPYSIQQSIIYSLPTLNLTNSYSTNGGSGDKCQSMQVTTKNIYRIGSNQILEAFQRTYPFSSTIIFNFSTNTATAFAVSPTQTRIAILQNASNLTTYPLSSFSINFTNGTALTQNYQSFYLYYDKHVYLYSQNSTNTIVRQWQEYKVYNFWYSTTTDYAECSNAAVINMTGRRVVISPNRNWTIFWDSFSNIQVYHTPIYNAFNPYFFNDFTSAPPFQCTSMQLIFKIASDILTQNCTSSLSFSSNSSLLLIQFDNSAPIKIFNLLTGMVTWSYNYNNSIVAVQFLDSFSINLAILEINRIVIIQINTNTIVYNSSNINISANIFMDYSTSQLILCKSNVIETYSLQFICNANIKKYTNAENQQIYGFIPSSLNAAANTICLPCQSFCKMCYSHQSCVQCIDNYINVGGSCFPLRVIGSIEGSIGGIANNCLQITSIILSTSLINLDNTIAYISLTPLLYFYLRVYSFVYITSAYSYLRLPLPKYMQQILNVSAWSVKPSLPINFSLNISEPNFNIFPQISIDIVKMCWMQAFSFIITLFLLLIVKMVYCATTIKKQSKTSLFYQIFTERWWEIATAHIVALLAGLTLTNSYLIYPLNSFLSRINFQLRILGLGIAIIFPFYSLSYIVKRNKINEKKSIARKKKRQSQQSVCLQDAPKIQKIHHRKLMKICQLDKFHLYLLNVTIPSLVLVSITLPFLVVNSILSLLYLPISYHTRRQSKMRFVVAFIFFLYHHFYFLIYFYQNNDTLQAVGCSGACLCLFLGILGEIVLFLMQIVSNAKQVLVPRIKDLFEKNRAVQDIQRQKTKKIAKQTGLNFKISPQKESNNKETIEYTLNPTYLDNQHNNKQQQQHLNIQPIPSHIKIAKTFRAGQLHFTISQNK